MAHILEIFHLLVTKNWKTDGKSCSKEEWLTKIQCVVLMNKLYTLDKAKAGWQDALELFFEPGNSILLIGTKLTLIIKLRNKA